MAFHISESGAGEHKILSLEETATGTKANIYVFGALLNAFSVQHEGEERNLIDGYESTADAINRSTPFFKSAKLSPFVCRLKEGHYTFADATYKIGKYYNHREAIHGLIYDAVFTVVESEATDEYALVSLSFDYDRSDAGFPFFYRIRVTYHLQSGNHLTITTEVTNLSATPMPVADGWHPYFSFGKKVNGMQLFLNTKEMIQFDNRLLPTGQLLPYTRFAHPQKIEETEFDNCFVLNEADAHAACAITDLETGLQLSIYPDRTYPYLQVFIPNHRNSIAIENLSSVPDAFNNGIGLIILEPSQRTEFTTSYVIKGIDLSLTNQAQQSY